MAVTESGLFYDCWSKILNATQLAFNPLSDVINCALFTNTITPNFDTDIGYGAAPYNANEVAGAGYVAGGAAMSGVAISNSPTKTLKFTAAATSWAGATITNARCALLYDNTLAGKNAFALINLGGDFSSTAGTFTITWAAAGIFTVQMAV